MMEIAVYGLPARMPHWSFGVRYTSINYSNPPRHGPFADFRSDVPWWSLSRVPGQWQHLARECAGRPLTSAKLSRCSPQKISRTFLAATTNRPSALGHIRGRDSGTLNSGCVNNLSLFRRRQPGLISSGCLLMNRVQQCRHRLRKGKPRKQGQAVSRAQVRDLHHRNALAQPKPRLFLWF